MTLLSLLLAYAGFLALAASMQKHSKDILGRKPAPILQRGLYRGGWLLLFLSALPAIAAWDVARGLTAWTGLLTVAAITVVLLLTYREKLNARLAFGAPPALTCAVAVLFF